MPKMVEELMRHTSKLLGLALAISFCVAGRPSEGAGTSDPDSNIAPKENQLAAEFRDLLFQRSQQSIEKLQALCERYRAIGQEQQLSQILYDTLRVPRYGCGWSRSNSAGGIIELMERLRKAHQEELLRKVIVYAASISPSPSVGLNDVDKFSSFFMYGNKPAQLSVCYFGGMGHVRCSNSEDVEFTAKYSGPLGISFDRKGKDPIEIAPLIGKSNIREVGIFSFDRKFFKLVPTLNNATSLRTKIEFLAQIDLDDLGQITEIQLYGHDITSAQLRLLAQLPRLQKVRFDNSTFIDGALGALGELRQLKNLIVWQSDISDRDISSLAHLNDLQALDLSFNNFNGTGLRELRNLPQLSELRLYGCKKLTPEGKSCLGDLKHLRTINVQGETCVDRLPGSLSNLPNLEQLEFALSHDADTWLADLGCLRALKEVDLSHYVVTPSKLQLLSGMTGLQKLKLPRTVRILDADLKTRYEKPPVTDEDIRCLSTKPNLHSICAADTHVTGTAFATGFNNLADLDLSECPVTDETLQSISQLRGLKTLRLSLCPIKGSTLDSLSKCKSLKYLDLYESTIDDSAIPKLAQLKSVKVINLGATKISLDGLHELKAKLPNCTVFPKPNDVDQLMTQGLDAIR